MFAIPLIPTSVTKKNAAFATYLQAWQFEIYKAHLNKDIVQLKLLYKKLNTALINYDAWQKRPCQFAKKHYQVEEKNSIASRVHIGGNGRPLVIVPSLINGTKIFDICADISLVNFLIDRGFSVSMIKWQKPKIGDGNDAQAYVQTLHEITKNLDARFACSIGYCLGGTLLNLANLHRPLFSQNVLLGAPWNFHHHASKIGHWAKSVSNSNQLEMSLDQTQQMFGIFPSLFIDHFFALLNPLQFIEKFSGTPTNQDQFDAIEVWLTEGRDLDIQFAKELFIEWMKGNKLNQIETKSNVPTLIVSGRRDHIAPTQACLPIARTLNNFHTLELDSGHMGMLVGRQAKENLWPQIIDFL